MSVAGLRDRATLALRRAQAGWLVARGTIDRRFAGLADRVAVLMYHRVLPDAADVDGLEPGMYVRRSNFERHLDWLAARGVSTGSLGQRHDAAGGGAALTFDDGWRDNMTEAWPALQSRGLGATVFLVRDWVADPQRDEFLAPDDVRELAREGLEFGAHTLSHPRLDALDRTEIVRELRLSREAVSDWTGERCRWFAYPFGALDEVAVAVARELFEGAVTTSPGWWRRGTDDAARIPRASLHQDMTGSRSLFEARIAGLI